MSFNEESYEETGLRISKETEGKIIKSFSFDVDKMDNFIIISFTDETTLRIQFDWIYDIKICTEK